MRVSSGVSDRYPKLPNALSFKFLRKYLADWMTRHGGEEMGMVALSHARQTVLSKHYSGAREFERFTGEQIPSCCCLVKK